MNDSVRIASVEVVHNDNPAFVRPDNYLLSGVSIASLFVVKTPLQHPRYSSE